MSYINSINNNDTDYLISGVSDIIVCDTDATTADKVANAMDAFNLDSNLSFKIKFTNGNTASSPTLNLNDTGAKSITTTTSDYILIAGIVYDCYYDGTNYVLDNELTVHTSNTSNPHNVTKAQIGLENCNNTADADKSVASASKLTTARTTYVTLGTASTSATRDWSGITTIPVSGILSVVNGGTGESSLSNITVGNSSKLNNIPVQTSSIGGSNTTTNYWSYVTKSMFTTSGGYIKYSNGLLIQWGRIGTENSNISAEPRHSETVNVSIAYTSQNSFMSFVTSGKADLGGVYATLSNFEDTGVLCVTNTSNSSIQITSARSYYPWKWITIGY